MAQDKIRISEIFGPTIQGEGALIGQPTVFVRTGGCDYRCSWCDTMFAVDNAYRADWKPMSAEEIFTEIEKLSGGKPIMVSLSGGNPAIQPLKPLITLGHDKGYSFALETQGSIAQDWFTDLDVLTLSPKPPSSEMETDYDVLQDCMDIAGDKPEISLKIVVMDETDYLYAIDIAEKYPLMPVYLQPVNHTPPSVDKVCAKIDIDGIMARMRWLVDRVKQDRWHSNVHILPQLHTLLWGNERGV